MKNLTVYDVEAFLGDPDSSPPKLWLQIERGSPTRELIAVLRRSKDPRIRSLICHIFDQSPKRSAREALLEAMFDDDVEVRKAASDAYGKVCRAEDGSIVFAAYRLETNRTARYNLVLALGAVRFQRAAKTLIDLIDDVVLREPVVWTLGELDGPEVTAALESVLAREPGHGMAIRIRESLNRIAERSQIAPGPVGDPLPES